MRGITILSGGCGGAGGNAAANAQYSNFFGFQAGYNATNAANSIFIGKNAGNADTVNNTVSGSSIAIGDSAGTGGFSNSIAIGASAVNTATNQFLIGSTYTNFNVRGIDYVWPSAQAAGSGYTLTNDGSGNLSWSTGLSIGGSSGQLQYDNGGSLAGVSGISYNGVNLDANDATFRIVNYGDTTKRAIFDAGYIDPATTRTFTFPNYGGTFALATGISGGQTIYGGTSASQSLTLGSTTNATKGKILFGTSAYDEVNNRLGIGTVSPSTMLTLNRSAGISTVQGGSANDSTLLLRVNTDGATANAIEFQYGSSGSYLGSRIVSEIVSGGGADLFFQTGTNGAGTYTSKMTIKRDGNIGIGVTSPGAKLTIEDTNKTIGVTSSDVNFAVHTTDSPGADLGGTIGLGGMTDVSANRRNYAIIAGRKTNATNANTSGYLSFSTNNGTSMVERMRILDTGLVGIGTNTPLSGMHLAGTNADANIAYLSTRTVVSSTNMRGSGMFHAYTGTGA
jgi:hypothetical protein